MLPHPKITDLEVHNTMVNTSHAPLGSQDLDDEHVYHNLHADHRMLLTPTEVYVKAVHSGEEKAKLAWWKTLILSIVAGGYVGLGGTTCYLVGGTLNAAPGFADATKHDYGIYKLIFGAFGFPFAFMAIIICGSELFTSQCVYTFLAWLEGKITMVEGTKMLFLTWVGNFIGCVIIAWLFWEGQSFAGHDHTLILAVNQKLSLDWGVVVIRGIFANWFVAIATWMSNAALDLAGKGVAVFLPIFSFAAIGFEHCIANQFVLTMGCFQGAETCSFTTVIWNNLIPATIGNWIGAVLLLALPYALVYGQPDWKMTKERFY